MSLTGARRAGHQEAHMRGSHVPATGTTTVTARRGPRAARPERHLARVVATERRCGGTELTTTP